MVNDNFSNIICVRFSDDQLKRIKRCVRKNKKIWTSESLFIRGATIRLMNDLEGRR